MNPKIVVIGSSNTDMVIKADRLPMPGETILGGTFFMNAGGKGANQAVAAARLGGNVSLVCKTGNDIFGKQSIELFKEECIDISHIISDAKHPSGVALIAVDKNAENCIVVAPGANAALYPSDLQQLEKLIEESSMILMQLEIPLETVFHVASTAFKNGVSVCLNPAPACELTDELLRYITIITPNKVEAEMLTGIKVTDVKSAQQAAQIIKDRGVQTVIVTLGSEGAVVLHDGVYKHVAAARVEAVDTTAAGDVFNGALVVALSNGKNILEATEFACKAAAISVTRLGAQSSAPYKTEVDAFAAKESVLS